MQVAKVAPDWPVPSLMQLALDAINTRPRFKQNRSFSPSWPACESAAATRRRVRDPTIFPHLAARAAFGDRHDDPVLVNHDGSRPCEHQAQHT